MRTRTRAAIGGGIAATVIAAGLGGAVAAGGGVDSDVPITGDALERASTVALEHLGEGRVTETEEGDEDSYYEVEVTLDDGREVDVQLDEEFNVVGAEPEPSSDDRDG